MFISLRLKKQNLTSSILGLYCLITLKSENIALYKFRQGKLHLSIIYSIYKYYLQIAFQMLRLRRLQGKNSPALFLNRALNI